MVPACYGTLSGKGKGMDQVTVINTKNNLRRIYWSEKESPGKVHCLKLGPGANLVDADKVARIQQIPYVKALFDRNTLFAKPAPKENKGYVKGMYIEDLSQLKPTEALKAIQDCRDPKVLSQWANQDGRQRVKDALIERHEALVAGEEDKGQGEKDPE